MNNRMRIGVLVVAVLAASGTLFAYWQMRPDAPAPTGEVATDINEAAVAPVFDWQYRPIEDGEIPHTAISVVARYGDDTVRIQEIDTIEGGCNEYVSPDEDVYRDSTMIICYYAGLGRYYKVIETEQGYAVQRKVFEEASPEYDPPQQEFETIARF